MRKSDVACPECKAGYRRIELETAGGAKGEFRCLLCRHLLEVFDGRTNVAIRLTVQPEKTFLSSKPTGDSKRAVIEPLSIFRSIDTPGFQGLGD